MKPANQAAHTPGPWTNDPCQPTIWANDGDTKIATIADAGYYYAQMFREIVISDSGINSFVRPRQTWMFAESDALK